eukprot:4190772-Alexandrium_andersonii.AAC.1
MQVRCPFEETNLPVDQPPAGRSVAGEDLPPQGPCDHLDRPGRQWQVSDDACGPLSCGSLRRPGPSPLRADAGPGSDHATAPSSAKSWPGPFAKPPLGPGIAAQCRRLGPGSTT